MADRKKIRNGCLITLLIFFVVIAGLVIAGGVFLFNGFKPNEVEVDFDKEDLESVYDKLGAVKDDDVPTINDFLMDRAVVGGEVNYVETVLSEEEITAALDEISGKDDYIQNINVEIVGDDQFNMSFELKGIDDLIEEAELDLSRFNIDSVGDLIEGQTIYIEGEMTYDPVDGIELGADKLTAGFVPVNESLTETIMDALNDQMNATINNYPDLSLDKLEITDDGLIIEGDIPSEYDTKD